MILKRPTTVIDRHPQAVTYLSIATFVPIARWQHLSSFKLSNQVEGQLKKSPGHRRLFPGSETLAAPLLDLLDMERPDCRAGLHND
jgi:hypothetical protein